MSQSNGFTPINCHMLKHSKTWNDTPLTRLQWCLGVALILIMWLYLRLMVYSFSSLDEISNLNQIIFPGHHNEVNSGSNQVRKVPEEEMFPKFPHIINRTSEYETIIHPGQAVLKSLSTVKKEKIETLDVPKLWLPEGGRNRTAPDGKLMSKSAAVKFGSKTKIGNKTIETIYVSIASYRDYQCPTTIESLYKRATHPERIRVAVVDQYDPGSEKRCVDPEISCEENPDQALCKFASQIDSYEMDAKLGVGPVFARHLGHRMYRGEYFAMQIDAHVTFVRNWDVEIIDEWVSTNNEMGILSVYLSDVTNSVNETTGERKRLARPIMCDTDFEGNGIRYLRHGQQPEGPPGIHGTPTIHPFWAAGFSFARGHFVVNVPYDQHLPMIFQGEEISIGVRGFTYGYDYYTPEKAACYHMYAIGENKKKRQKVKLFWEHANLYQGVAKIAVARLVSIIHMQPRNKTIPYNNIDEQKYGLGKERSAELFLDVFGIHMNNMTVEHNLCSFVVKKMQQIFVPKLRKNGMGLDYDKIKYRYRNKEKNNKNLWWQDDKYKKKKKR